DPSPLQHSKNDVSVEGMLLLPESRIGSLRGIGQRFRGIEVEVKGLLHGLTENAGDVAVRFDVRTRAGVEHLLQSHLHPRVRLQKPLKLVGAESAPTERAVAGALTPTPVYIGA